MTDLTEIYSRFTKDIETLETKKNNHNVNSKGHYTHMLLLDYEVLAALDFVLNNDKLQFSTLMKKIGLLQKELFKQKETGYPISDSYVSIYAYQALMCVLASGHITIAQELAEIIIDNVMPRSNASMRFDDALGFSIAYLVSKANSDLLNENLGRLKSECSKPKLNLYQGLFEIIQSIHDKNGSSLKKGFIDFSKAYRKLTKKNSYNSLNKYLNIWGIGLANLAIHRGMKVEIDDEFIPRDLLIEG